MNRKKSPTIDEGEGKKAKEKKGKGKICFCKLNNTDDNRKLLIDYRSADEKFISERQKEKSSR